MIPVLLVEHLPYTSCSQAFNKRNDIQVDYALLIVSDMPNSSNNAIITLISIRLEVGCLSHISSNILLRVVDCCTTSSPLFAASEFSTVARIYVSMIE